MAKSQQCNVTKCVVRNGARSPSHGMRRGVPLPGRPAAALRAALARTTRPLHSGLTFSVAVDAAVPSPSPSPSPSPRLSLRCCCLSYFLAVFSVLAIVPFFSVCIRLCRFVSVLLCLCCFCLYSLCAFVADVVVHVVDLYK